MRFVDNKKITGHLQILKRFPNGKETIVFDDHNIIVSGMSVGLSYLFTASGSNNITDYHLGYWQAGVSGFQSCGAVDVSTVSALSGPLSSMTEYGENCNLELVIVDQYLGESIQTGEVGGWLINKVAPFVKLPFNKVTRINNKSVRYTLVLDEEAAISPDGTVLKRSADTDSGNDNAVSISEVGLFMTNPTGAATHAPVLCAYRSFSGIPKTKDFALVFRWTLNF